jgi:pyruvate formate lyase activating enzyme
MGERLATLSAVRSELAMPHRSGKLVCVACAHRCKLGDGARGVCLVRSRRGHALSVPWGYTAGVAVDPIEKKPFFHFVPGARALSFGMLGCDMRCDYCQNWFTSQSRRDAEASDRALPTTPETLVGLALDRRCAMVTSTYNEPLITSEWAHDIFVLARREGILTSFVSNGHATPEVLDYMAPVVDAWKVDLKTFNAKTYLSLGGKLQAVLDGIRGIVARGVWCEVVTLLVPGLNDSPEELREIARFLVSVSPDLPWHVTAFHPDYHMTAPPATPAKTLVRAAAIGAEEGLRFVYAGNLPGRTGDLEDTRCPRCGATLLGRLGYLIQTARVSADGRCPECGTAIPGRWSTAGPTVPVARSIRPAGSTA